MELGPCSTLIQGHSTSSRLWSAGETPPLHYAAAQGLFGLSTSVSQLGSALVDMQKNVDNLQKNMGTVKQVKEQLSSLSPEGEGTSGSDLLKKGGDSSKDMKPKFRVA
jgi:hypothetical protein